MLTRRELFEIAGPGLAFAGLGMALAPGARAAAAGLALSPELPAGVRSVAELEALPGKKPLIKLAYRAPNYETPLEYFHTAITPNDAFFVRYHLSNIPQVDVGAWKISVGGDGANGQAQFTMDDLKRMPATEFAAVNQCSGNRRGLFQPHVPGVQWGSGAMGCARWKGVRLKDLLDKAGLKKEAIEISFNGADSGVTDRTPDFIKSLPVWKALDDATIVAYEMNGEPLPHFNGFPARLIVPGWTGTYWMKHLITISALTKPQGGFWMNPGYRIPAGKFPVVAHFLSQETETTLPITEMLVNSLITNPADGANVRVGEPSTVSGLAWDAGYGIQSVEISRDGGRTWTSAQLGEDLGRFAFRTWSYTVTPSERGKLTVMVRAANRIGQVQVTQLIPNPAGYQNNVIQTVTLNAA
ncbi:MAG TPA: molybdopterin-dependent oxidoreductase [Xanthobacteraceae bacterium]|jgi:DMSO/TMAO reductase YedYZ molybdopterin-dependent catalytic subunit